MYKWCSLTSRIIISFAWQFLRWQIFWQYAQKKFRELWIGIWHFFIINRICKIHIWYFVQTINHEYFGLLEETSWSSKCSAINRKCLPRDLHWAGNLCRVTASINKTICMEKIRKPNDWYHFAGFIWILDLCWRK